MHTHIEFSIALRTDAEPGTGMSTHDVDNCATYNHLGQPILRSSHLKGLMRQRLGDILHLLREAEARDVLHTLFGARGSGTEAGHAARIVVSDATAKTEGFHITRTAIDELGTASTMTLRTSEAYPKGTTFDGTIRLDAAADSTLDLATRLALMSIESVGGSRRRGAGACKVKLEDESRTPGQLLRELVTSLDDGAVPKPRPLAKEDASSRRPVQQTWIRLTFVAREPVCCPETPQSAHNIVRSGFTIPASAVQGACLHRINRVSPGLATACFQDPLFRAWPMLPVAIEEPNGATSVRVSLTHRMSKHVQRDDRRLFKDTAIQPYDWRHIPGGAPLKAADGVLLTDGPCSQVTLWRATDMPRVLSAHAVHESRRNLFTVEAMAPMVWSGLLTLPSDAADVLLESLKQDSFASFGKSRSIRGGGQLTAEIVSEPFPAGAPKVFIAQSPLALNDEWDAGSTAETAFEKLLAASGWPAVADCWAKVGMHFGWSRHAAGNVLPQSKRLRALPCIEPGSVVTFKERVSDLIEKLTHGAGSYREAGMGALIPHPGIAETLWDLGVPPKEAKPSRQEARLGYELWKRATADGPSPAQIAQVTARVEHDTDHGLKYLQDQMARTERIARRWKPVWKHVKQLIEDNRSRPDVAVAALRVWQDVAIIYRKDRA